MTLEYYQRCIKFCRKTFLGLSLVMLVVIFSILGGALLDQKIKPSSALFPAIAMTCFLITFVIFDEMQKGKLLTKDSRL